MLRYVAKH